MTALRHPSRAAYFAGCQCDTCHPSSTAYRWGCRCLHCEVDQRRQRKLRRMVGQRMLDAGRATAFVRQLVTEGHTIDNLSVVTGLDRNELWCIHDGRRTKLRASTVRRLSGLTRIGIARKTEPQRWLPVIGAARRVQALHCVGWHAKDIAEVTGIAWTTVAAIRDQRAKRVTAGNWQLIEAAFTKLAMTPAKNESALRLARRKRWAPPLAWDSDDEIDDPAARPNVDGDDDQHLRWRLYEDGASDAEIARETGVSPESVRRWRTRHGLTSNFAPRGRTA